MSEFKLIIRTPEKELFAGEVHSLTFHAEDGQLQILPHHASLMTTVLASPVWVKSEGRAQKFVVRNGMFYFDHQRNEGLLLCLFGEEESEILYQNAKDYLAFIQQQLAEGGDLSEFEILYLQGEKLAVEQQIKTK